MSTTPASTCSTSGLDFRVNLDLAIPTDRRPPWSPDDPHLYGVSLELLDEHGVVLDRVSSHVGLRGVTIQGHAVKINGRTIFQRLVLDQGHYPDGIRTAPTEEALVRGIEMGLAAGFNGARLHQKVFEERFLYHCDRLGYLVWGGRIGAPHRPPSRRRCLLRRQPQGSPPQGPSAQCTPLRLTATRGHGFPPCDALQGRGEN